MTGDFVFYALQDRLVPRATIRITLHQFAGGHGPALDIPCALGEAGARNTHENATLTKALLKPEPGERWLLVTSAFQMPRAVRCFRQAGFDVIPWPTDYRVAGRDRSWRVFASPSEGLRRVDMAAREWAGLLVYWFTNRASDFFPAPVS